MCEHYNYRLDDMFLKSYKNGGLTYDQIILLFDHSIERYSENIKTNAIMHGAKFDDSEKPTSKQSLKKEIPSDKMVFAHPKVYKKLSDKKKKELTAQMMHKHKSWANNSELSPNRKRK